MRRERVLDERLRFGGDVGQGGGGAKRKDGSREIRAMVGMFGIEMAARRTDGDVWEGDEGAKGRDGRGLWVWVGMFWRKIAARRTE